MSLLAVTNFQTAFLSAKLDNLMMFYGNCPYWECPNRNELGYCKTTCCINPNYQSETYRTTNYTIQYKDITSTDKTGGVR